MLGPRDYSSREGGARANIPAPSTLPVVHCIDIIVQPRIIRLVQSKCEV